MIEALLPDRVDEPFREQIRPGTLGGREHVADPHASDTLPERVAVDRVAIAEEVSRCGVVREASPIGWAVQGGRGMFGHVDVEDPPALVGGNDQEKSTRKHAVGTVKKSRETRSRTRLARNVRQVWDGVVCRMLGLEFRADRSGGDAARLQRWPQHGDRAPRPRQSTAAVAGLAPGRYGTPLLGVAVTLLFYLPEGVLPWILAFFSRFFLSRLYIGASDLLPEARDHDSPAVGVATVSGMLLIFLITQALPR
jgi:hypothetical protein